MKLIAASLIAFTSVAVHAQAYSPPSFISSNVAETPTMKRAKYQKALALRDEAQDLLKQDNGTLTHVHAAYIRKKACAIIRHESINGNGIVSVDSCGG
jgi:hypothetical protein